MWFKKENNDKLDHIRIKNFFSVKEHVKRMWSYRLSENICKAPVWQRTSIESINKELSKLHGKHFSNSLVWHVSCLEVITSIFTMKKAKQKKWTTQIHQRMEVTGKTAAPKIRELDKWIHRITAYQSRSPEAETFVGIGQERKTETVILKLRGCWRLIMDKAESERLQRAQASGPRHLVRVTSRSPTRFSQWRSEKDPLMFPTRTEICPAILTYVQSTLFLTRKIVLPESNQPEERVMLNSIPL